jgi:hypothetical protein
MSTPPLNTRQLHRWIAAKALFQSLKDTARRLDHGMLMYDGTLIDQKDIEISDTGIYVRLENCRVVWFEPHPEYDHGVHTKTQEFEREVRKRFVLVQKQDW